MTCPGANSPSKSSGFGHLPPLKGTTVYQEEKGVIFKIPSLQSSFETMVSKLLFFVGEKAP